MTLPYPAVSTNTQVYAYAIESLLHQTVLYDPDHAFEKDPEAREKMQRDATISGALDQLHTEVAGANWTFQAGGTTRQDRRMAAIAEALLKETPRLPSILYNLATADFVGSAWALLHLEQRVLTLGDGIPRLWTVVAGAQDIDKRRIQLRRFPGAITISDRNRPPNAPPEFKWCIYAHGDWQNPSSVLGWKPLEDIAPLHRWVQHVVDTGERGMGYGYGLQADIYYLFYAKSKVLQFLLQGLGRWGQGVAVQGIDGLRDGEPSGTPGGSGQAATKKAQQALQNLIKMNQGASYVYDKRDSLDVLELPSNGAQFCLDLISYIDTQIRTRIRGPAPGAESNDGKGSYARDKVRDSLSQSRIGYLRACLEATIDNYVTGPILMAENERNLRELGLAGAATPSLRIAGREYTDPMVGIATLDAASRLGLSIRKDEAYAHLGFSIPNEEDEVILPAQFLRTIAQLQASQPHEVAAPGGAATATGGPGATTPAGQPFVDAKTGKVMVQDQQNKMRDPGHRNWFEHQPTIQRKNPKPGSKQEWDFAAEGEDSSDEQEGARVESAALMLRLPPELALLLPNKPDDDSPAHITMLFIGAVSGDQFKRLGLMASKVARELQPFPVALGRYDEFQTEAGQTVAHMVPESAGPLSLAALHDCLRAACEQTLGAPPAHGQEFRPHVTLAYLAPGEPYTGLKPTATFEAGALDLWARLPDGTNVRESYGFGTGNRLDTTPMMSSHHPEPLPAKD